MARIPNPIQRKRELVAAGRTQRSLVALHCDALTEKMQPGLRGRRILAGSAAMVMSRFLAKGSVTPVISLVASLWPARRLLGKSVRHLLSHPLLILGTGCGLYLVWRFKISGFKDATVQSEQRTK